MIPVFQTLTVANDGQGNCFNACIASIMERSLREVATIHPKTVPYWSAWDDWLAAQSLEIHQHGGSEPPKGWSIASGEGFRVYPDDHELAGLPIRHACVAFNGEVLHDPYPGGKGLKSIDGYMTLEPVL